ncbi:MAG: hypothetical protein JXA89_21350, partial [Anaerolineae bacterium]|nr:hypothetical protein [Anaerolineae bacterium]
MGSRAWKQKRVNLHHMLRSRNAQLVRLVGRAHLLYLGLLPSLATFALLRTYGYPARFVLFIAGVAAVGIYLAIVYSYTRLPDSPGANVRWTSIAWALLDGPLFALIAWRDGDDLPLAFAINAFVVDGLAIWLAILWLSFVSPDPTRGQRIASIAIMVGVLAMTGSLFWPYARDVLWGQWMQLGTLATGVAESAFVRVRLLDRGSVVRGGG